MDKNQNSNIREESPLIVTIRCTTYNQEQFIRKCLDGFVMQKTDFRFEAIVHDDASTDGTAAIIREYAEKYPDIIKPIFETENQYSKQDGSLDKIMNENTHGKYVAFCEGDDFWTDPLKLQKQVDFLEKNNDYSMCFHNAQLKNESNCEFHLYAVEERDYYLNELFENWIVPTASILVRSNIVKGMEYDSRCINGDIYIVLLAATAGKVKGFKEVMSVYRYHNNGVTRSRALNNFIGLQKKYIYHFKFLKEKFPKLSVNLYKKKIAETYFNLGTFLLRRKSIKGIYYITKSLFILPSYFCFRIKLIFSNYNGQ